MQLSQFTTIKTYPVTNIKGYNRFRWDLRHMGIDNEDDDKNVKGPYVKPGLYEVRISIDKQPLISKEFSVVKDPNTDISQNTFIELEEFQLNLFKKIKQATNLANEIKTYKSSKKINKNKKESLNKILNMLETKEGEYMQPMLIDQFKYLYSMITEADQEIGKDAYDRFKELSIQLEGINIKSLL